jgi:hypothetical protein
MSLAILDETLQTTATGAAHDSLLVSAITKRNINESDFLTRAGAHPISNLHISSSPISLEVHLMWVCRIVLVSAIQIAVLSAAAQARINTIIVHNSNEASAPGFKLKVVTPASSDDAATNATFSIVDGRRDDNGGELDKLRDGKVPTQADQPSENFFFAAGTSGGRLLDQCV